MYSWIVVHQSQHPAFHGDTPYVVAIIELEAERRMHARLVDCARHDSHIGMPVEVVFERVNEEISLPVFRPATTAHKKE